MLVPILPLVAAVVVLMGLVLMFLLGVYAASGRRGEEIDNEWKLPQQTRGRRRNNFTFSRQCGAASPCGAGLSLA